MKSILILILAIVVNSSAMAAKKVDLSYQPEIKMKAEELLSLPSANRLEVAKSRGSEFVSSLEVLAFAKGQDYGTRWKALTLVAQIQGAKSEAILQKAVKAPEWYMRNAALLAYQEVLPKKAKTIATDLLKDKALVVRSAAVQTIASHLDEDARETLWTQLGNVQNFRKKQSLFIRGQILSVLAQDPLEKEMPMFMKHLREEDARLHAPAVSALEKVTARKMGKKTDSLVQKRELWMKWAKSQGPELSL